MVANLPLQLRDSEETAWHSVPFPQPPLSGGRAFHTSFLLPQRMPQGPGDPSRLPPIPVGVPRLGLWEELRSQGPGPRIRTLAQAPLSL